MRIVKLLFVSLVFASASAFAGGSHSSPPPSSSPATATSASQSASLSASASVAKSVSIAAAAGGDAKAITGDSTATVGDVNATGGAGGSANQSQSADNAGNSQSTQITQEAVRNAPSVAQGSLIPSGCGAGGNAGGSGVNGSGFLGIAFTTSECYRFLLAQSFAAIGMPDTACDVLLTTKAARRAFKDRPMPDCTMAKNKDVAPSVVVVSQSDDPSKTEGTATKEYVNEVTNRALRDALAK